MSVQEIDERGPVPAPDMPPAPPAAEVGVGNVARLIARLGAGKLDRDFDAQATGCRWARAAMAGHEALRIAAAGKSVDVVGSREYSDDILLADPATSLEPGRLKREAMRFLAPHALTIESGASWERLRRLNEAVLSAGATHPWAQTFLEHVRAAFDRPVRDIDDVRRAMGLAMTGIVLGVRDDRIANDVTSLFGAVQSPLRRKLLGFLYAGRRERLYTAIARGLEDHGATDRTLLVLARMEGADLEQDVLMQQVPHWMFTFTGSGTDLLTRTLALINSRPPVRRRAIEDIERAGPIDRAESIDNMPYVEACILEAGRLFAPVTRTFHQSREGRDVVHYFPLLQRDDALGLTVHEFRPERWLGELDAPAEASNLFLRGPRSCPGRTLILFVCRAALATLLTEHLVMGRSARLGRDPLPLSFPEREARFTVAEATT